MIKKQINEKTTNVTADSGMMLTFQTEEQMKYDPRKYKGFKQANVVDSQIEYLREITIAQHQEYETAKGAALAMGDKFVPQAKCSTCKIKK